jgi:hypothetical protein
MFEFHKNSIWVSFTKIVYVIYPIITMIREPDSMSEVKEGQHRRRYTRDDEIAPTRFSRENFSPRGADVPGESRG